MKNKKKGQSALEYLVTYGWAILAIVIIAAVLWYFGVFNPSKWVSSKQCGGMSSFTCIDYAVDGTTVQLSLGNKVGRTIVLTGCAGGNVTLTTTSTGKCNVTGTEVGSDQLEFSVPYFDSVSKLTHTDTGFVTT